MRVTGTVCANAHYPGSLFFSIKKLPHRNCNDHDEKEVEHVANAHTADDFGSIPALGDSTEEDCDNHSAIQHQSNRTQT